MAGLVHRHEADESRDESVESDGQNGQELVAGTDRSHGQVMCEEHRENQKDSCDQHLGGVLRADAFGLEVLLQVFLGFQVELGHRRKLELAAVTWGYSLLFRVPIRYLGNIFSVTSIGWYASNNWVASRPFELEERYSVQDNCVQASRMVGNPFGDIVDLATHRNPAVTCCVVLGNVFPTVRGHWDSVLGVNQTTLRESIPDFSGIFDPRNSSHSPTLQRAK